MQPSTDLLQTKIRIPRAHPQLVGRPHLNERLEAGIWRRLTQVSAPPGFGKTTALTAWAQNSARPFAWLTLDEGDNSLERFLRYLVAALQKIYPGFGAGLLPTLQIPAAPDPSVWVTGLVNELEAQASPAVLILDDTHVLSAPAIFEFLNAFIENLSENLHLVLAGRSDLPLSVARLRARGELNELRAADLRFAGQEAGVFLSQMGLALSPEQIEVLETRTEGWIAGLQLAALAMLAMRDRSDTERFIKVFTGSHRYILDYLADEVLHRQNAETQEFLLFTSILERFNADLCETLVKTCVEKIGEENPLLAARNISFDTLLASLERSNLFLIPLDDERRWYRYHTLFADLLRYRLDLAHPGLAPHLHRCAAAWFEKEAFPEEAVGHYLAAGEDYQAGVLVEATCSDLMNFGQINRVLGWLDRLAPVVFAANPRLHLVYTWGLMARNQFNLIEPKLDLAENAIFALTAGQPEESARLWRPTLVEITASRALVASIRGDVAATIELSNRTLADLPEDHAMRSSLLIGLAVAYRLTGEVKKAIRALEEATQIALQINQVLVAVGALSNLADLVIETGDLARASELHRQALQLAAQASPSVIPSTSLAYAGLSEVYYQQNELDQALQSLQEALKLDALWQNQEIHTVNLTRLARIQFALGDWEAAGQSLAEATRLADKVVLNHQVAIFLKSIEAQFQSVLGGPSPDWTPVEALIARVEAGRKPMQEILDLRKACVLMSVPGAGDRPAEIESVVTRLAQIRGSFLESGLNATAADASLCLAQGCAYLGQPDLARANLVQALRLAQPGGLFRIFMEHGPTVQELLQKLVADQTGEPLEPGLLDFARHLMDSFLKAQPASGPGDLTTNSPYSPPPPVHPTSPISERELEVLSLVAEGLANPDIAARLVLSPGTIKRHIHNIFEKLDVDNRSAAVHRARQMGLL